MTFEKIKGLLSLFTVGIAGCGGLGSNCAAMLVRSGVKNLIIADFDSVQESNLNRQFFFEEQIGQKKCDALKSNLLRISSDINIQSYNIKLDKNSVIDLFAPCDIIVEAFDLAEMKLMIIETVQDQWPEKKIVCASGLAGLDKADQMQIEQIGNLTIVGDFDSNVSETNPPMAPKVMIAAALQANVVIRLLLNRPPR